MTREARIYFVGTTTAFIPKLTAESLGELEQQWRNYLDGADSRRGGTYATADGPPATVNFVTVYRIEFAEAKAPPAPSTGTRKRGRHGYV